MYKAPKIGTKRLAVRSAHIMRLSQRSLRKAGDHTPKCTCSTSKLSSLNQSRSRRWARNSPELGRYRGTSIPIHRQKCTRLCAKPHRLEGLKPLITTRPSGTRMRSTSRKVAWGSGLSSRVCGSVTRSMVEDSNGNAHKSHKPLTPEAIASCRTKRCGMRLACNVGS